MMSSPSHRALKAAWTCSGTGFVARVVTGAENDHGSDEEVRPTAWGPGPTRVLLREGSQAPLELAGAR